MADFLPMSREMLLAKGECCFEARDRHSRCVRCPWAPAVVHRPLTIDPRIETALRSGEYITICSPRKSLVPSLTLLNRVKIIYNQMSYLSDRDILAEIMAGNIICEPFNTFNLSNSSIDLRLGKTLIYQKPSSPDDYISFKIDENGKLKINNPSKLVKYDLTEKPFILKPGGFVLGVTLEKVGHIDDITISDIKDKSSLARIGLSTSFAAGFVDAGNVLNVTLEIKNNGNIPIELQYGQHVCQIRFSRLSSSVMNKYNGKYLNSTDTQVGV